MLISDRKNQKILNNLVFIDGFSNSGKSLFSVIFGYLERCEQWQIDYKYEYIASLEYLDKITFDAAKGILNLWVDNHIYDLFISRGLNLRPTDVSSPYTDGLEKKYLERLHKKDGDIIVNEINEINPILPIHIHYIIGYSDVLLKAFDEKLKLYVITLRNPIELIKFWYEGNWVNKIGKIPREYQLCIDVEGMILPWFTADYKDAYIKASDLEKAILTVYYFHKKMFTMVQNLEETYKNKVLFVPFEKFVKDPDIYIDEVCKRLETTRSSDFNKIMKKVDLPKKYDSNHYLTSDSFIERYNDHKISDICKNMLLELESMYKEFIMDVE